MGCYYKLLTSAVLDLSGRTGQASGLTNLFMYPSASRSHRAVQLGSEVLAVSADGQEPCSLWESLPAHPTDHGELQGVPGSHTSFLFLFENSYIFSSFEGPSF